MKETLSLFCIYILGMEIWCLHSFDFSTYKSEFCHTISYIWLFLINFSSIITGRLLLE